MQTTSDTLNTYTGFSLLQSYFYLNSKYQNVYLPNESSIWDYFDFFQWHFFAAVSKALHIGKVWTIFRYENANFCRNKVFDSMQTTFDTYTVFSLLQNYSCLKIKCLYLPNKWSTWVDFDFFSRDTFFDAVHAYIISYISNRSHTSRLRNCRTLHKKCLNQQDRSYFTAVRIIKR